MVGLLKLYVFFSKYKLNDIELLDTLYWCCYYGQQEVVRFLIEQKNAFTYSQYDGSDPLCRAIEGNSLDIVRYLTV